MLDTLGYPVTAVEISGLGHSDEWIVNDCSERRALRAWLADVLGRRPGTHEVRGRVTDAAGRGVAAVRIEAGPMRWTDTNASGGYVLRSLIDGRRAVTASRNGYRCEPSRREVVIAGADVTGSDFVARPSTVPCERDGVGPGSDAELHSD